MADSDKLDCEAMKAALAEEQQQRMVKAGEEIKDVCEKYKVRIEPQAVLTQGGVSMSLQILPTE